MVSLVREECQELFTYLRTSPLAPTPVSRASVVRNSVPKKPLRCNKGGKRLTTLKSAASVQTLMDAATTSVGVASPSKDLILTQEASLLLHVEEQAEEIKKVMVRLSDEKMKRDAEIITSTKGIGDKTALNFLT